MKKRKTIIAALVLALLLLVGGAVAYFTDKDEENNDFTIGQVKIELLEPNWVAANAEDIVPGQKLDKDPLIGNIGTVDAYVFLTLDVPCDLTHEEIFEYVPNTAEWTELTDQKEVCTTDVKYTRHVYYYGAGRLAVLAKDTKTTPLFKEITLRSELRTGDIDEFAPNTILVEAYGIQAKGLADTTPAGVWANFAATGSNG